MINYFVNYLQIQSQTVTLNDAVKMLEAKSESLKKAQKEVMIIRPIIYLLS